MEPIGTDPGNLVSSLFPERKPEMEGLFARGPAGLLEGVARGPVEPGREEFLSYSLDSLRLSLRGTEGSLDLSVSLFEMNYQSVRAIQGGHGEAGIERTAFFAQVLRIEYRATGSYAADPEGAIDRLRDAFTPEKTARRIAEFALSRYAESGKADTPEARAAYRDGILPAIERGYGEALALLGTLPEEVRAGLEETIRRVRDLLESFVREGRLPDGEGDPFLLGEPSGDAATDLVA